MFGKLTASNIKNNYGIPSIVPKETHLNSFPTLTGEKCKLVNFQRGSDDYLTFQAGRKTELEYLQKHQLMLRKGSISGTTTSRE